MRDAGANPATAEILLLSDSVILTSLIELNLQGRWPVRACLVGGPDMPEPTVGSQVKAVILAVSQQCNEPVVILHRTRTIWLVGKVPLIIISVSVQRFEVWPEDLIWYFDFPPDWGRLSQTMSGILGEGRTVQRPQASE